MILRAEGRTWCGAVADCRPVDVDGAAVAAAIRGRPSPYGAHCPPPGGIHDRVGYVRPGMRFEVRTVLAAAGRSRGLTTPQDDDLASVRDRLASFEESGDIPRPSSTAPDADRERLRERVAELRGRVQAFEACDRDASDERAALRDAARRLSELETERIAATETRTQARDHRDHRERRMRLSDREGNLARDARASLVDELQEEFAAAVHSQPAAVDDPFEADPVTAALAVLRVASVRAPVVLAVDRFEHPAAAARWLDAPVVRL